MMSFCPTGMGLADLAHTAGADEPVLFARAEADTGSQGHGGVAGIISEREPHSAPVTVAGTVRSVASSLESN